MDNLTKEELRSLTIEKLNGMTEEQLDEIANQVIELLDENDIKRLPKEVRRKLKIIREGGLGSWKTWIVLIISALIIYPVRFAGRWNDYCQCRGHR
mgnify:CR=1 FL=1